MSAHVMKAVQLGFNSDASKNFVLETLNDGTMRLARGNVGETTQDILTIKANGAVVPSKAPAFSAYANSAQTLSGVYQKVNINTEEFDSDSCFDTSNARFTPTVEGYYQVNGRAACAGVGYTIVAIFKNGSEIKIGGNNSVSGNNAGDNVSALIYLNGSTDYIELYAATTTAGSLSLGAPITYFQAHLARAI